MWEYRFTQRTALDQNDKCEIPGYNRINAMDPGQQDIDKGYIGQPIESGKDAARFFPAAFRQGIEDYKLIKQYGGPYDGQTGRYRYGGLKFDNGQDVNRNTCKYS